MIYITGDIHGEKSRFDFIRGKDDAPLTEKDTLIVCGDFGFLFYPPGRKEYEDQQRDLDLLEELPYQILFVCGNHENFDLLESYPEEEYMGGRVHRIRKNIRHLMRGGVFQIEGLRVFAMGGAYSIDRYLRTKGFSWWPQELPSNEEYKEATKNLADANHQVDLVVSHTAPREMILRMGKFPDMHDAELTGFLEWVMYEVSYRGWFFGHWHQDREFEKGFRAIYYDTVSFG